MALLKRVTLFGLSTLSMVGIVGFNHNIEMSTINGDDPNEENIVYGSGTTSDPYRIYNFAQIEKMTGTNFSTANYKIMQDIDVNKSIETIGGVFNGAIDGDGKHINIKKPFAWKETQSDIGIFSTIGSNGSIKDLILNNLYTEKSVLGNSNITYGLVYGTLATRNSGRAENIIVNGEMNIWFVGRNTSKFGGLFGTNSGTVMNSQVLATANPTRNLHNWYYDKDDYSMFGMLVAENTGNIYNSNATGSLNYQYIVRDTSVTNGQASKSAIGGLIGVSSNTGVIDKSYAAVNVATSYSIAAQESEAHAGGLVGRVSGRLANSYTTGSVNTTWTRTTSNAKMYINQGGIAGVAAFSTINNTFNVGTYTVSPSNGDGGGNNGDFGVEHDNGSNINNNFTSGTKNGGTNTAIITTTNASNATWLASTLKFSHDDWNLYGIQSSPYSGPTLKSQYIGDLNELVYDLADTWANGSKNLDKLKKLISDNTTLSYRSSDITIGVTGEVVSTLDLTTGQKDITVAVRENSVTKASFVKRVTIKDTSMDNIDISSKSDFTYNLKSIKTGGKVTMSEMQTHINNDIFASVKGNAINVTVSIDIEHFKTDAYGFVLPTGRQTIHVDGYKNPSCTNENQAGNTNCGAQKPPKPADPEEPYNPGNDSKEEWYNNYVIVNMTINGNKFTIVPDIIITDYSYRATLNEKNYTVETYDELVSKIKENITLQKSEDENNWEDVLNFTIEVDKPGMNYKGSYWVRITIKDGTNSVYMLVDKISVN